MIAPSSSYRSPSSSSAAAIWLLVRSATGSASRVRPPMGPVWLVLPTYNEAENLERIVTASLGVLNDAAPDGHRVLVVDDGSPDGTGAIADRLASERPDEVEVLHRPAKAGLGQAYLAGFRHALAAGADRIFEMDADFSHDPADLARLLAATTEADLAIGSRYVDGGSV